jgi:hypothetical protein
MTIGPAEAGNGLRPRSTIVGCGTCADVIDDKKVGKLTASTKRLRVVFEPFFLKAIF